MKTNNYKIIFFGTPDFATTVLKSLIIHKYKPMCVITGVDKPVGRKQVLIPSSVKQLALKHNINILQPKSFKNNNEIINKLSLLKPDLFIIAAYGLILPKNILNIPKYKCINIHPSLLPKYRGASPIQSTIINGEKQTGVTVILMDEKMDHGDIISVSKLKISNFKITYQQLSKQLANLSGELIIKTIPKWINNKIKPIVQKHSKATFTKQIKKQDGKINWNNSCEQIERIMRAYDPWPGVYTNMNNKILKIINADILKIQHNKVPGTVFLTQNKKLAVACKTNALILKKVQLQGKKIINVKDFLNGYPQIINTVLK